MVKKSNPQNGNGNRLDEAMTSLIQAQAQLVASMAEANERHARFEREMLDIQKNTDERFSRIDKQIAEIIRVLAEHGRILERLPEAIRDKIGFKPA
jgi:predicted  nucleic acid-binding Zn-ribbon protein